MASPVVTNSAGGRDVAWSGQTFQLASHDRRLLAAARAMRFPVLAL